MDGAERVGHEDVGHVGQRLCEVCAVLLLADVEAQVLKQHDLTRLESGSLGLCVLADDVGSEDDFLTQKLGKSLCDGRKSQLGLPLALGLAEVGAGNDGSAVLEQIFNSRNGSDNTLVAGDLTGLLVLGNVEIAAEQNLFSVHVYIVNSLFVVIHGLSSLKIICI